MLPQECLTLTPITTWCYRIDNTECVVKDISKSCAQTQGRRVSLITLPWTYRCASQYNVSAALGTKLSVGMSLRAWAQVLYENLSPCSRTHDASTSLAGTICISMKWNLAPLSVSDSWQFRPDERWLKLLQDLLFMSQATSYFITW